MTSLVRRYVHGCSARMMSPAVRCSLSGGRILCRPSSSSFLIRDGLHGDGPYMRARRPRGFETALSGSMFKRSNIEQDIPLVVGRWVILCTRSFSVWILQEVQTRTRKPLSSTCSWLPQLSYLPPCVSQLNDRRTVAHYDITHHDLLLISVTSACAK